MDAAGVEQIVISILLCIANMWVVVLVLGTAR